MTSPLLHRRRLLAAALLAPLAVRAQGGPPPIDVYKSAACGCCRAWIDHLNANGFTQVRVHDVGNTAARARLGMPSKYASCHTATVAGYVIEGHVPAADLQRLLRERPAALGLAVPNMPLGSPGMDGPDYDNRTEPFDVLLVARDGSARVYNSYFRRS